MTSQADPQAPERPIRAHIQARVFCVAPPSIPGISAAGGLQLMLQDRSGGSVGFLAQRGQFLAEPRRPELDGVRRSSPRQSRSVRGCRQRQSARQGVALSEVYAALQRSSRPYVNDFSRFGANGRCSVQAEGPVRTTAGHPQILRPNNNGDGPVSSSQRSHK